MRCHLVSWRYSLQALALLCVLAATGELHAQERPAYYSVATIASSHPNAGVRQGFTALADDFSRLQRVAATNARFFYSNSPDVNAFATKHRGEHLVVIHAGLLRYFGNDRAAVSAVLAHELAHVKRDHVTEGANAQAAIRFVADLVGLIVDIGMARSRHDSRVGLGQLGGAIGGELAARSYNRDQEREADADSVSFLIQAGVHPQAAVRVQERFAATSSGNVPPLILATHPPSAERVTNLKEQIQQSAQAIATRFPSTDALRSSVATPDSRKSAELESRRAAELGERLALQARADQEFAVRQNATRLLEEAVFPDAATKGSGTTVLEPVGDCRNRGPNTRICLTKDAAGNSVVSSCNKVGGAWECRTIGGQ